MQVSCRTVLPMLDRGCKERWQGVCCRGTKPGLMAETSPRGIDRHRRGAAGGRWRGTSQWRTFCSTCSPAVGGRQYRVRGDAQVRLRSELEAPMKLRPLARHQPPNSSLPELDAIFIIPGAAKRHKRLRTNQSVLPHSLRPTVDHSLVAGGAPRQRLEACLPVGSGSLMRMPSLCAHGASLEGGEVHDQLCVSFAVDCLQFVIALEC